MLPVGHIMRALMAMRHAGAQEVTVAAAALQHQEAFGSRLLSSSTASCSSRKPSSSPLGKRSPRRADDPDQPDDSKPTPAHLLMQEHAYDDEGQAQNKLKFVSRERRLVPRPPFYRPPIYFPTITLQMLRLSEEQRQQIRETGWTREVAFKTTPNVTKLEIKAILESMYGMQVERVHTINYLGRKHVTYTSRGGQPRRTELRGDDWKKAYVLFRPPEGMQVPEPPSEPRPPMLEQLLAAKGLIAPHPGPQQGGAEAGSWGPGGPVALGGAGAGAEGGQGVAVARLEPSGSS